MDRHASPVWADVDGEHIIVNTAMDRRKERNIRRDPRVALAIVDRENPYLWIEIRGRVTERIEGDEAAASIDRLTRKYLDLDAYPHHGNGEKRFIFRIEPITVLFKDESV
jgi:PPOX class probable F420-dependent enzyme